jgi:hypothetical protein
VDFDSNNASLTSVAILLYPHCTFCSYIENGAEMASISSYSSNVRSLASLLVATNTFVKYPMDTPETAKAMLLFRALQAMNSQDAIFSSTTRCE